MNAPSTACPCERTTSPWGREATDGASVRFAPQGQPEISPGQMRRRQPRRALAGFGKRRATDSLIDLFKPTHARRSGPAPVPASAFLLTQIAELLTVPASQWLIAGQNDSSSTWKAAPMNRSVDDQAARTPTVAGVPLLDLARQHGPLQEQFAAALAKVCQSGWFCLGPEVKQLEESLARYCGVKHAIGCASGSDALLLALMALEVGPGDEVIVPSFTFFATATPSPDWGPSPSSPTSIRRPSTSIRRPSIAC